MRVIKQYRIILRITLEKHQSKNVYTKLFKEGLPPNKLTLRTQLISQT